MGEKEQRGDRISGTIRGDVSGQVAIGKGIRQVQSRGAPAGEVSEEERAQVRALFEQLKQKVAAEAPAAEKEPALRRVEEVEETLTSKEPDPTTIELVKRWFVKHVPQLAGAVVSLVVHPLVGKLAEAAASGLSEEIRRRVA